MYTQKAARVHADELYLCCRHGCLFACVSVVPESSGPRRAQDISRLRTSGRLFDPGVYPNISQRWNTKLASAGRCVADAWQKVSGIPRLPLSDLRSAREWLGGDVLFPGRVTIFPLYWEHAARTTKVPTCTDSSSKVVISESWEAAEGIGRPGCAHFMHAKTRLSHVASAANQPPGHFSHSSEISLLLAACDMLVVDSFDSITPSTSAVHRVMLSPIFGSRAFLFLPCKQHVHDKCAHGCALVLCMCSQWYRHVSRRY